VAAAPRYGRFKLGIAGVAAAGIMFGAAYFQSASPASAAQLSSTTGSANDVTGLSSSTGPGSTTTNQTVKNVTTTRARKSRGS
jgi:hypothetical protein